MGPSQRMETAGCPAGDLTSTQDVIATWARAAFARSFAARIAVPSIHRPPRLLTAPHLALDARRDVLRRRLSPATPPTNPPPPQPCTHLWVLRPPRCRPCGRRRPRACRPSQARGSLPRPASAPRGCRWPWVRMASPRTSLRPRAALRRVARSTLCRYDAAWGRGGGESAGAESAGGGRTAMARAASVYAVSLEWGVSPRVVVVRVRGQGGAGVPIGGCACIAPWWLRALLVLSLLPGCPQSGPNH